AKLFEIFIIDRLKHNQIEKVDQIVKLLQKPEIKESFGLIVTYKEQERSVLVTCIEKNYIKAFRSILNSWPEDIYFIQNINENEKKIDKENSGMLFSSYVDNKRSHTLLEFVVKNLYESSNNISYYQAASQILMDFAQKRPKT